VPSTLTAKPVLSQTSPRPINGLPRCASSICNPGSESASFCAAIAIGRQTIGRGSTRGGSAGMSRKLAAAWPPPEIVRPPTEYLMITNERQKTTHSSQFLDQRARSPSGHEERFPPPTLSAPLSLRSTDLHRDATQSARRADNRASARETRLVTEVRSANRSVRTDPALGRGSECLPAETNARSRRGPRS
jgi:hypothetical protein